MANNTKYTGLTNYANYHTFSKLQVGNNVNFAGSINRSGHTVTNTDAWLDDVPFFNTFTTPSAALAAVGKSTVKNDLVSIAVAEGDIATGIYRRNDVDNSAGDKTFSEIFVPYTIGTDKDKTGAPALLNKNDKAVVRVWTNQVLTLLDGGNNSNANSEGQAARIIIDGAPVEQFIAVPDVARSGYPSAGYGIKVYNDGVAMTMDFGTVTNTFFDVPFAGVIMFGGGTDGSVYTIDCFEYIGDKLAAVNTKIADIQETIENLTIEAGEGIKQIKQGTGITVDATDSLKPIVSVDTTVIATAAALKEATDDITAIQETISSDVVSSVTASTTAQTAGITVGGTTTAPEITVAVGTVDKSSDAVVTGKAVATAIETAKEEAISDAKVTVAKGTGITVTASEDNLTYTVAVDDTIATTSSVEQVASNAASALSDAKAAIKLITDDHASRIGKIEANEAGYATTTQVGTAKTEAITAAKTETESQVDAAKTEIKATTDDHETRIAAIEDTYATSESVTTLGNTSLAAASTEAEEYQVKVSTTGTVATGLTITVDTKDIASAAALSALDTKVTEHIELAAGTYLEVEVVDSLESVTEPKTNKLYLVPNTGKGNNVKDEYIYTNNSWELIGTTEVDLTPYAKTADVDVALALKADKTSLDTTNTNLGTLQQTVGTLQQTVTDNKTATDTAIALKADQTALNATNEEVAKKANSADVYTKTEVDAAQVLTDAAIEAAAAKGQQGIDNAATAAAAAKTAQDEVDALEGVVAELNTTVGANKTAAEAGIQEAKDAAKAADDKAVAADNKAVAAQGEVDALEIVVSTLSQTVANNKSTTDTAIALKADQTALDETNATVADHTDSITEITGTTIPTLEGRLDALDQFLSGNEGEGLTDLLAAKVDNVEGGSNGITIETVVTESGRVATLTVAPDTEVKANSDNVVTSRAVNTAIGAATSSTLDSAKSYAEEQIEALTTKLNNTATAENTALSVTQENGKITAVSVTKGKIEAKDANLVDGGTVYAVTSALQTAVDKKLDASTYEADMSGAGGISERLEALESFVEGADEAYASIDTETAASNAQKSADKKLASIGNNGDTRVIIGTATADGDTKSQTISLAANVATTDSSSEATDGTVYTKTQVDAMVADAKPEAYVATVKDGKGTTTTGQVAALTIKDGRETVYENDLWGTSVTLNGDVLTVSHNKLSNPNASNSSAWIEGITMVAGNKAYNGATIVANIQTEMIKDGTHMFDGCSNLTSFNGDLSNLIHGGAMFQGCTNLTSFDDDSSDLPVNLSSLTWGHSMFSGCSQLSSFNGNLSSLIHGNTMFSGCSNLASFNGDLSSLTNGEYMFSGTNLASFNSDLSSLTTGYGMFWSCDKLTSFNGDLFSLTTGDYMFNDCSNLVSFNGDLSSLTDGNNMFINCPQLTSFCGDLSSLTTGYSMFSRCKLDTESVECIADVTKSWGVYGEDGSLTGTSDGKVHNITIDVADTTSAEIAKYIEEIAQKGWTVATNHTAFAATSAIDGDKPAATFMIAHPATEDTATYVDAAGNFFTIETAVSVIGIGQSEWTIFASIEDAIAEWELTPVTK